MNLARWNADRNVDGSKLWTSRLQKTLQKQKELRARPVELLMESRRNEGEIPTTT